MNDESAIFKFGDNKIIIPSIVWEELNDKKDSLDPNKSYLPRRVLRLLTDLSMVRPLKKGVKLSEIPKDSKFYNDCKNLETEIFIDYNISNERIDHSFLLKKHDYSIIACAANNDAVLVTSDYPLLGISKDFVLSEEYRADNVKTKDLFKGYTFETVSEEFILDFYSKQEIEDTFNLYPNEFIVFVNEGFEAHQAIGIKKRGKIKLINFDKDLKYCKMKIKPNNLEQKMFLYLLQDDDIKCVSVTGVSGKGKTLISCDYALSMVEKGVYSQFLYTKSIIPVDEDEYMGFNSGSENEKFNCHIRALFTAIECLFKKEIFEQKTHTLEGKVKELIADYKIGTLPLANIRGMNVFKKIVMLDEAQNTKKHVMKSLVSRLTDDSKIIISGDIEQIDDPKLSMYNNGLSHLIEQGKEEEFIAHIQLDISKGDNQRGKLSTFAAKRL